MDEDEARGGGRGRCTRVGVAVATGEGAADARTSWAVCGRDNGVAYM